MKCSEINIRDPFILIDDGRFYLYGTRAANFGQKTGGFDVYYSEDMEDWKGPFECFNSKENGLNSNVNWAPEVHKYRDAFYMFATFTKPNNLRGTYILKADNPMGPFKPHSDGAVTPYEWESLDGTFYIQDDKNYIVFCHEHTQIIDGTICFAELNDDLTQRISEPITLFSGSSPFWADKKPEGEHYTTDGPFMYKTFDGTLLMLWSSFIGHDYVQTVTRFKSGKIDLDFEQLYPIITGDGGHGMLFKANGKLYLTFHTPNQTGFERVKIVEVEDLGDKLKVKE